MASVKGAHSEHPSQIIRPAPSRSFASSGGQTWHMTEREVQNEQELLERVQGICREYGQRMGSQVSIISYQAVPPEAVSMIDPPEQVWLVHLHLVGQVWDQTTGQAEVIAALRSGEVCILLR